MAIRSLFIKPEYGGPAPIMRSGESEWDSLPTWSNRKNPGSLELDVKAASLLQSFSDLRMKRFMVWMNENSMKCRNNYDSYTWFKNTTNNWDAPKGDIANAKIEIMRRICKLAVTGPQKMEDWILIFLHEEGDLIFPQTLGDIISPKPPGDDFRKSWMQGKFLKPPAPDPNENKFTRSPLGFMTNPQLFTAATPILEETPAEIRTENRFASRAIETVSTVVQATAETAANLVPTLFYTTSNNIGTTANRAPRLTRGVTQNTQTLQTLIRSSGITLTQVLQPVNESIDSSWFIFRSVFNQSMRQAILDRISPGPGLNPVMLEGYTSLPRNLENALFNVVHWSENGYAPTRVFTEILLRSLVNPEELNSALAGTTITPRTWTAFLTTTPPLRLAAWYYNTFFIGFNNVARSMTDPFITPLGVTPGGRISRGVGAVVGTPLMVGLTAFSDQFVPVSSFYSTAISATIIGGSAVMGANRVSSAFLFRELILASSLSTMVSAIIYSDLEESVATAYGSAFILGNIIVPLSPIIYFTPQLNQVWFDISNWARSQEAANRALARIMDTQSLQANPLYQGFQMVVQPPRAVNSLVSRGYSQFFGVQNVTAPLGIVWQIGNTVFQSGTAVISAVAPDLNTVERVFGLPSQNDALVPVVNNSVGFVGNTMGPILADTVAAAWGLLNTAGVLAYLSKTQTANTIWQQYDSSRNNMVSEAIRVFENSIVGLRYNAEGSVSSLKIDTTPIMNITNMEAVIDKVKEAVTIYRANIPMNEFLYFDFYTDPNNPTYADVVTGQTWITATRDQVLKGVLPLGYSSIKGSGLFDIVVKPVEIFRSERTWNNYFMGRDSGQILLQALQEINPDFSEETEVFRFQPSTILLRRFDEIRREYIRNDRIV